MFGYVNEQSLETLASWESLNIEHLSHLQMVLHGTTWVRMVIHSDIDCVDIFVYNFVNFGKF
jgi:hypothetical protein